jgi:flagellar biosynthetic protein FliQ
MTSDQALELISNLLQATMFIAGPILFASLFAGVVVGILQAATQINEASVSFIVKAAAVMAVLVAIGPALAAHAIGYAKNSLSSVEHVVR